MQWIDNHFTFLDTLEQVKTALSGQTVLSEQQIKVYYVILLYMHACNCILTANDSWSCQGLKRYIDCFQ